ncbi:MAG: T9SS type A sorting domain-containing protein [Lentimicrobium sp.]
MKKIFLSVFASLAFILAMASPDIYSPELVAPGNNASNAAPNVLLDWNAVTGQIGLHYEVQLSNDNSFSAPLTFATELSSYRMSELFFGQQYFWRVRAIDSQGTSDWSEIRSFTVIVKPVLSSPVDDVKKVAPNVKIKWAVIGGLTHYDYQIDTLDTFDSPYAYIGTVSGSAIETNTSSLLFGKMHYWRVRARHAIDTSEWSLSRRLTVIGIFENLEPENNANNLSPDVLFEWKRIDGLDRFEISISPDNQFDNTEIYPVAKTLTKVIPDTLHFGMQYFWKIEAIHSRDTLISETRTFNTVDMVSLNSPENNATNVDLVPYLKWTKISGVLSYSLELASNAAMTGAITYNLNATATSGLEEFKIPIHVLDSAGTYYWRVKALSSKDTSNWSNTWNFRCAAVGVEEPSFRNGVRIYPSPASEVINIQMKSGINGKTIVTLFDLLGKVRIEREVQMVNGTINNFQLGTFPNGIYMLRLDYPGNSVTSKLIIRK